MLALAFFRGFSDAGVVLCSLGDACSGGSNGVFSLMLHPFCVLLVLLVWCCDHSAVHVPVLAMSWFH